MASSKSSGVGPGVGPGGFTMDLGTAPTAIAHAPIPSRRIAVAGMNIFKILEIKDDCFAEVVNLRLGKSLTLKHTDVAWANDAENVLATASGNKVVEWDLGASEQQKLKKSYDGHTRTVNTVKFHPSDGQVMLSGSQDSMVRRWDRRMEHNNLAIDLKDSVRQLSFNPHNSNILACALEGGALHILDLRNPKPEGSLRAHDGPVYSIDWHPNSKNHNWIATAGRDKMIRVWDMEAAKQDKLVQSIQTIASVAQVLWRPNHDQQIASYSLIHDKAMHIWDFGRPYIPSASYHTHRDVLTAMLWDKYTPNTIITASKDGSIQRFGLGIALHPERNAEVRASGIRVSACGEMCFFQKVRGISAHTYSADSHVARKHPPKHQPISFAHASILHMQYHPAPTGHSVFVQLAAQYVFDSDDVAAMCVRNGAVARSAGISSIAQTWDILSAMYAIHSKQQQALLAAQQQQSKVQEKKRENNAPHDSTNQLKAEPFQGTAKPPLTLQLDQALIPPQPAPTRDNDDLNLGLIQPSKRKEWTYSLPTWDSMATLPNIIAHYAEHGDVQMSTMVMLVFGEHMCARVPMEQQEMHFHNYASLLDQQQMWVKKLEMVKKCWSVELKAATLEATIYTACGTCTKNIINGSYCKKCDALTNTCSYCHQVVKGLYMWCQGCGHGGHHCCIRQWLTSNKECPTGCGHLCEYA